MDLFEAIARRYSYRGNFTDAPVPREDLTKIVEAGLAAPSGCNAQTTTFVIADDEEVMARIRQTHSMKAVGQAKAFIACCVETEPPPVYKDLSFQVEDCAAAVENILLAVTALGYATVWIDGALRKEGRAGKLDAALGVPSGRTVRVLLPIGVPADDGPRKEKKPFDQRAWFNRHG
jgi:nitroreductase